MNDGTDFVTGTGLAVDYTKQFNDLVMYVEIITGGVIELIWIAKVFVIIYIIFGAWKVVRK